MPNFRFGKRSKGFLYGNNKRPGVHPDVAKLAEYALKESNVDFGIIDGVRTSAQQQKMYANGKSELDGINRISDHQRRLAIDVLPVVKHNGGRLDPFNVKNPVVKLAWMEVYRAFMRAGMKLGLVIEFGFGYDFRSGGHDYPHLSVLGRTPKDYSGMSMLD